MQPQPVEDRLSAGRHPLMLGLGLVGGGDRHHFHLVELMLANKPACVAPGGACFRPETGGQRCKPQRQRRSEEHTSELQSLMRSSYAVFCLKNKNKQNQT